MQLSPAAQQIRELSNKIARLNEYDTHTSTGEPDHDISSGELMRLKIALRPLVASDKQSRFTQVLNKMQDGQPVTTDEAKLITVAFLSMADIIANDNGLLSRLRKDINDFNTEHEHDVDDKESEDKESEDKESEDKESEDEESEDDIASDIDPDLEYKLK